MEVVGCQGCPCEEELTKEVSEEEKEEGKRGRPKREIDAIGDVQVDTMEELEEKLKGMKISKKLKK